MTVQVGQSNAKTIQIGDTPAKIVQIGSDVAYTLGGVSRWLFKQEFTSTTATATSLRNSRFGDANAIDIHGDTIAVCAPKRTVSGQSNAGSIFIFQRAADGSWIQQQELNQPTPTSGNEFGGVLSLRQDILAARSTNGITILKRSGTTWTQSVHFLNDDTTGVDARGVRRLALGQDSIGRPMVAYMTNNADGRFIKTAVEISEGSWSEVHSTDVGTDDTRYGQITFSDINNRVAYGMQNSNTVYVLDNTDGTVQEVAGSDVGSGDRFGRAVGITRDFIAVGADGYDVTGASNVGAVYIFKRNGIDFNETQIITPPTTAVSLSTQGSDHFGRAVALNDNYLFIGQEGADDRSGNSGTVYIYKRNTDTDMFEFVTKIYSIESAQGNDAFGLSMKIHGDDIVVGARYGDISTASSNEGTVTTFALETLPEKERASFTVIDNDAHISSNVLTLGTWGVHQIGSSLGSTFFADKRIGIEAKEGETLLPLVIQVGTSSVNLYWQGGILSAETIMQRMNIIFRTFDNSGSQVEDFEHQLPGPPSVLSTSTLSAINFQSSNINRLSSTGNFTDLVNYSGDMTVELTPAADSGLTVVHY